MEIKMTESDLFHLLMSSMQYALGRRSYITSVVSGLIINHFQELSTVHQQTLYERLNESINASHQRGDFIGDPIDDETWQRLRRVLKGEINA